MRKVDKVFRELSDLYEFYRQIKKFKFKDEKKRNRSEGSRNVLTLKREKKR